MYGEKHWFFMGWNGKCEGRMLCVEVHVQMINNLCHKFMKVMKIVSCQKMIVMAHFFKQESNCFFKFEMSNVGC